MIKVKFHASWRPDDYVKNWISKYTKDGEHWNNIKLVDGDDYDYICIFNYPKNGYKFDPKKAILFQGEPDEIRRGWGPYYQPNPDNFFRLFDVKNNFCPSGWTFESSYRELSKMKIDKTKLFSGVISAKNQLIGQIRRLNFVRSFLLNRDDYTHYGRGTGLSTVDKSDAIMPYKYTFNCENTYEKNWYTEKITDAIVGESLCFWDGCKELENFYDEGSFIRIDLSNPSEAIELIDAVITEDVYESYLPKIKEVKHKILNKMQPMAVAERIINGEL